MQFLSNIFTAGGSGGPGGIAPQDDTDPMEEYEKLMDFLANERDKYLDSEDYQRAHILETQRLGIESAVAEMKDPEAQKLSPKERAQKVAEKICENLENIDENENLKGTVGPDGNQNYMQDYLTKNPKLAHEAMTDIQELVAHKVNSMEFKGKAPAVRGLLSTLAMDSYEMMTARPQTPAQKAGLAPTDKELEQENSQKSSMEKDRDNENDEKQTYTPGGPK